MDRTGGPTSPGAPAHPPCIARTPVPTRPPSARAQDVAASPPRLPRSDTTFAVARVQRERELAAARYVRDRDLAALEQAMARLDAEEAEAKASTQVVEPSEALSWLRDLPALWGAADDSGRRLLTEALFGEG
jgi:hypothetical protein